MSERAADGALAVRGVVLAHGSLADGLIDAVDRIIGLEDGALIAVSNLGLSPERLAEEVRARLVDAPTILFTDLPSGSCTFAARWLRREEPGLVVISGVNLPLLLDFVMHRHQPLEALVPRLLEKGRAAIDSTPTDLEGHEPRSAARR